MSYLRGSANYVWCTTSVLGKGATGAVYQGVSKHDGEVVAVKTFNQLSHMRPQEVQMREFEVLKKVKHENIVKLLAIEEEQDGRGKVIVMELCTGGSLFNILDDPENTYGLQEDEFLAVLSHLSSGMKHLRDHNYVHRDLKPGNIMKFISEDGRVIYKLTDFGAARELEDDQEFMSLYGTEEYLHPDLYERAVLRKPVGKSFGASIDLWSIGVTMFHVATGQLPFRPYGGRKNKEMMYYITTKKESGVISGYQTTENGPIDWKRDLPNSCQLSQGLKIHITPLLAGLMEVDPRKRWTFDNFFTSVETLLLRKKVHVFYMNKIQCLRVYINVEEEKTLSHFQCLLMQQTDIPPENQILIFQNQNLKDMFDNTTSDISDEKVILNTSEDSPIILCHRENNNVGIESDSFKDSQPKFPTFPNLVNVENDASLAKHICAVGQCYKRRIEIISRSVNLIKMTVKSLIQVIVLQLRKLSKEIDQIQSIVQSIAQSISLMDKFKTICSSFISVIVNNNTSNNSEFTGLQSKIDLICANAEGLEVEFSRLTTHLFNLEQPVKLLYNRFCENHLLLVEWDDVSGEIKDISRSPIKAQTHVTKLRDSWQHLLRDRATRSLTYNDEQFHILERIKMQEKSKCLNELLNEECQVAIVRMSEVLSDWYKTAQAAYIQAEILDKDVTQCQENLRNYLTRLNNVVENYQSDLDGFNAGLRNLEITSSAPTATAGSKNEPFEGNNNNNCSTTTGGAGQTINNNNKVFDNVALKHEHNSKQSNYKEYVKSFNRGLKDLTSVQEEVWTILKENAQLVNEFQTLTLSLLAQENHENNEQSSCYNSILKSADSQPQ